MKHLPVLAILAVGCLALTPIGLASPAYALGSGSSGEGVSVTPSQPGVDEFKIGQRLLNGKDFRAALPHLVKAVQEAPKNPDYLTDLAYVERKTGDSKAAFEHYDQALKIDPGHLGALNYLGLLYVDVGKYDKAKEMLGRIEQKCSTTCKEYTILAGAIEQGDASEY